MQIRFFILLHVSCKDIIKGMLVYSCLIDFDEILSYCRVEDDPNGVAEGSRVAVTVHGLLFYVLYLSFKSAP
jgi:hypothetical protein